MLILKRIFVLSLILLISVFLAGCGGGEAAPTSAPAPAATSTPEPAATTAPTSAPTPTPVPADTPTPEPSGEQIKFEFVTPLSTAEQGEDIQQQLHDVEGILSIRGDEFGLTITYDPDVITPDDLKQQMAVIGFPVK